MRYLWMLAAAASLAACHNRGEDEVGAAPQKGDTTAVTSTAKDTSAVPTDSTMGQRPGATDTTMVKATDSTSARVTADSAYAPSPSGNAPRDTSTMGADSTKAGAWDSTSVSPTDTTKKQ
jgi:hypothetical protein